LFLLNAEANVEVDLTAVDVLDALQRVLNDRGIVFAMARVKFDLRQALAAAGFIAKVGEDRIFATLPSAVDAYVEYHRARYGRTPDGFGQSGPDAAATGTKALRASCRIPLDKGVARRWLVNCCWHRLGWL
jgi:hypothetical protein